MNTITKIFCFLYLLLSVLAAPGCVTGIIATPVLSDLAYDQQGVLRYKGQKVEGIKLELPWYEEMWPDNAPEWGFTLFTIGITAVAAGGGGGSSSGGSSSAPAQTPVAVTASSSGSSSGSGSTTTSGGSSGGGDTGGGGGAPPPPPPSGGGDELPF